MAIETPRPSNRRRWLWIIGGLIGASMLYLASSLFRGLSADEQKMVGVWTWESPNTTPPLVLYYGPDRILKYDKPPFARIGYYRWHIEDGELHFKPTGPGFLRKFGTLIGSYEETYQIEFVDDTVIFTYPDGRTGTLVRYKGNADKLKNARY